MPKAEWETLPSGRGCVPPGGTSRSNFAKAADWNALMPQSISTCYGWCFAHSHTPIQPTPAPIVNNLFLSFAGQPLR